jgi:hypothetical protein
MKSDASEPETVVFNPDHIPASYCHTRDGQWVRLVREYVKEIQFGEVHLTVHKGRVVEVRKMEKVRFDEA